MITVDKLDKHFGGVYAVKNCSFTVQEGSITSLVGPNGAGKTTVFNLVCGLIKPDKGDVLFAGKHITNLPTHMIARAGISRTFQQARLFSNMTVKENLLLAKAATDAELQEVLRKVHFP